ncbi:MAG TPA: hypothetical protein VGM33_26990 [Baekduia sp.]|jgi:catechol 2,3-dioxygenase-like lactoylglutathione lyase family enzyme
MLFHPSHRVPDLGEAETFFARVFGRPSRMMHEVVPQEVKDATPDYPRDYCTFTPIQDVLFDTIDPKRYVIAGEQRYPTATRPRLRSFGWYVEDIEDLYAVLRRHGIRVHDQLNRIADGDEPPRGAAATRVLFWALPEDAGLSYEFFPGETGFHGDDRLDDGWTVPPVAPGDPLGIERCSHHTVLTSVPERALRLVVDVLGGEVIHEDDNTLLGTRSTFVHLAGSTLEYATPTRERTPAHDQPAGTLPEDSYHAITWKVGDLDRVADHLGACGVAIRHRTADTIVTAPHTSLGVPWGFTTQLIANDPRQAG